MSIDCHAHRLANLYHFINHLAESPTHPYRRAWEDETGALTPAEQGHLDQFRAVHGPYGIDDKPPVPDEERFLQKPFTWPAEEEDAWIAVRDWVDSHAHFADVAQVFDAFRPRFERVWRDDAPRLADWSATLPRLVQRDSHAAIAAALAALHLSEQTASRLDVYLLLSTADRSGGSAELGADAVTVHCSRIAQDAAGRDRVLWTLYHKWTHTFQWGPMLDRVLEFAPTVDDSDFMRSRAACAMPGVVGFTIEVLARVVGSYCYRRWYPHLAVHARSNLASRPQDRALWTLVDEYVHRQRAIDEEFLARFWVICAAAGYEVF